VKAFVSVSAQLIHHAAHEIVPQATTTLDLLTGFSFVFIFVNKARRYEWSNVVVE